ncbi:ABC transporter permease [Hymenobacter negativus]|uniref:ABC transporter permease n=1 Tax=Hymenobacter negativus TaxID=2795026 RepID=A0ABS0QAF9_9BACT|nr:ABC transporter permease [Hymenobacter negativus]MBH8559648.1 ABC transporter permease [Hymenobacter negativus]
MAVLTTFRPTWLQRLALAWLALLVLLAAAAPLLPLPYPPGVPDLAYMAEPPFSAARHWLGTDPQGRDVLSTLVFGARTAVLLTLPAALLAALVGGLAGAAAGFWGNTARVSLPYWLMGAGSVWWGLQLPSPVLGLGLILIGAILATISHFQSRTLPTWSFPINALVMGTATALDTVPRLIVVVALVASIGLSASGLLAVLVLTTWPQLARLVRAQMLRVRQLPFVEAARAAGLSEWQVWFRHALPHALHPLRTALPLSIAGLLGLESTLSFLGIGLPPEVASWGRLLATVRDEPSAWWVLLFPSLLLTMSILSLNALSRFSTPKA